MNKNLLQLIINSQSETEILECKEAKNTYGFDKFGKYFCAFSNGAN